ncbi:MAG: hypothetical protein ACTSW2_04170 [Alphaproteobacteria bacterium]
MAQRFKVQEGQRYVQRLGLHYRPSIWKVGSIRAGTTPIPHALLFNVDNPMETKTISCPTLADKIYYELLAESAAAAA